MSERIADRVDVLEKRIAELEQRLRKLHGDVIEDEYALQALYEAVNLPLLKRLRWLFGSK